jgi:hypothetical protein
MGISPGCQGARGQGARGRPPLYYEVRRLLPTRLGNASTGIPCRPHWFASCPEASQPANLSRRALVSTGIRHLRLVCRGAARGSVHQSSHLEKVAISLREMKSQNGYGAMRRSFPPMADPLAEREGHFARATLLGPGGTYRQHPPTSNNPLKGVVASGLCATCLRGTMIVRRWPWRATLHPENAVVGQTIVRPPLPISDDGAESRCRELDVQPPNAAE